MFYELFTGNPHCYGLGGGQGGCVWEEPTPDVFADHLSADGKAIGIYPVNPDTHMCRWGCIDIDEDDYGQVVALRTAYRAFGIEPVVELSRSKGFHVWVFAQNEVPAATMRMAGLAARWLAWLEDKVKEVNPKQTTFPPLPNGKPSPGNYVRLPYPKGYEISGRQAVLDSGGEKLPFSKGRETCWESRTSESNLVDLAQYAPKERHGHLYLAPDFSTEDVEIPDFTPPYVRKMIEGGPLEGDRSSWLVRVAGHCFDGDLSPEETFAVLVAADHSVGKYSNRQDQAVRLTEIVERVFR